MQKPIAIIELYQHNEVLTHYCNLLLSGNQHLYVFCNQELFDSLPETIQKSSIVWFLRSSEEPIPKFIKKNEEHLRQCRFLLITTVFDHFQAFAELASWSKSALIVHSVHTWFSPLQFISIRRTAWLRDIYHLFRFIWNRQIGDRKKVLASLDYIGVPNEKIQEYTAANFKAPPKARFVSIPFGAYIGANYQNRKSNQVVFTITGSIGEDIRDYASVIEALKILEPKLDQKIKIVLLGKAKNQRFVPIIQAFKVLENPLLEVTTFSGFIAQNDYDNYLAETDYLILPLRKQTQFIAFKELTCYSKLSGSVNDMIRLGKPALVSRYFTVDDKIDSFAFQYHDPEDLANRMQMLIKERQQDLTSEEKYEIFSNYTYERLYPRLMQIIDG